LDLESNPDIVEYFSKIQALKEGDLNKSFSLGEIREIESYGLLCDINTTAKSMIYTRFPIFGMPMGRRMLIFAYHQSNTSSTISTPYGSVRSRGEGFYKLVGEIPMFTGGSLNALATSLPYFRDNDQKAASATVANLEFTLHLVPFGTAADQVSTSGTLDRDGVASVFLDTATVLTFGAFGAAGALTKFEKVAVYGARISAGTGILIGATEIVDKLRKGDKRGAAIATLKVSFVAIANAVALMKVGKNFDEVANNIIHPVTTLKNSADNVASSVATKASSTPYESLCQLKDISRDLTQAVVDQSDEGILKALSAVEGFTSNVEHLVKYAPYDYNPSYEKLVMDLYQLVKDGKNEALQLSAMQTLASWGNRDSGGYKSGYVGRLLRDVIPGLAENQKLPAAVLSIARRENAILYQNLRLGVPKY
jgi:hypothetical protein